MVVRGRALLPAGTVIACLVLSVAAGAADLYKVVVNSANPVVSLTRKEVSALFLRRTSQWGDGTLAFPVDGPDSPVRDSFSKAVHGRSAAATRSFWLQMIFSGRGVPPPEKPSDKDVIAYVKERPGAIGYVSTTAETSEVKVLSIQP